jgi:conjugal transfer pilin signal peptidase TrbI
MPLKLVSKSLQSKIVHSKSAIKLGSGLIGFALIAFLITQQTQLLESCSDSLQGIRYILVLKGTSFKRGDIVSIKKHKVPYVKVTSFAKRILGLPGDQIIRNGEAIQIGSTIVSLLKTTKEGRSLTALSFEVVPKGYVFVAGDHPRSFDSRYEEFGLVPIEKIYGKAMMTW